MNAQSIWAGEEYAWAAFRPKNTFPRNGKRCTAVSVRRRRLPGNERLSAEVLIKLAHDETEKWVPAREIVDFWDNYFDELSHLLEEDERKEKEREAAMTEQREKEQTARAYYADFLGVDSDAILHLYDRYVSIDRRSLDEAIERRIDGKAS